MKAPALSFSVLRLRDFRLLQLTRLFIITGMQAQAVIVGWQIYSITKSTFLLGVTGLTEAVPAIAGALVAGHIVDRGNPRALYLMCITGLMLNMGVLLTFAGGILPPPGGSLLPWIFGGVFVSGLVRSFFFPTTFMLVKRIVPHAEMSSASGWQSSVFQIAVVTGPATAGLLYGGYGAGGAWLLPASMMTLAFFVGNFIRVPHHARLPEKKEPALESMKAGWKFILSRPVLLSVMTLDMFAVLFGGATAMLPAYADQVLHAGSEGLGVLRASPAIGAILMSLLLAVMPMRRMSAKRLLFAVAGFGLCMIGFGLSTNFALSMLFLAISGAFDSVSVVMRGTLMRMLTPDEMGGRVSSISSMFIISSNEIGAFESGVAARFLGLVPSVVAGGIGTLIVVAFIATASPKFRKTVVET